MTVPAYTNIAHFRAPYLNAYMSGYGQDPPPPPPGPPGELAPDQSVIDQFVEKKNGVYYWRPEARVGAINLLPTLRTIFIGGVQELVEVVPFTRDEIAAAQANAEAKAHLESLSAYSWMKAKLKENKVVIAPIWLTSDVPQRSLVAVAAGDKANIAQTAGTPLYAILAEPSWLDRVPGGMVGVAIAGAAAVGVVGMLAYGMKKKRGGKPSFRMS